MKTAPRFSAGPAVLLLAALGCGDDGAKSSVHGKPDDASIVGSRDAFESLDADTGGDAPDSAPLDLRVSDTGTVDAGVGDGVPPRDARPDVEPDRRGCVDAAIPLDASIVDGGPLLGLDGGIDGTGMDASVIDGGAVDGDRGAGVLVSSGDGGVFTFTAGRVSFAVNASQGARIVTYAMDGSNVVTTPDSHPSNYGSTFWPSPQNDWGWPPPADLDPGPYGGAFAGGALTLTSATAVSLGLAVRKQFSMDARQGDVVVAYSLVNKGKSARAFAPWEITRVPPSGLVFFPMGAGGPRKGSQDLLTLGLVDGVAWFAYDASAITQDQKVFADGAEGWIAHADGGLVFIKAFTDITLAQAAPGEAEIELFANAAHTYVEVENQGAYASIASGASSTWSVRWFVRAIPANVPVALGSAALVDYVRGVVSGGS